MHFGQAVSAYATDPLKLLPLRRQSHKGRQWVGCRLIGYVG